MSNSRQMVKPRKSAGRRSYPSPFDKGVDIDQFAGVDALVTTHGLDTFPRKLELRNL